MTPRFIIAGSAALLLTLGAMPASAQDGRAPVLRYGNTSPMFSYDGRSDDRDFHNNGVFPGNFAGDPLSASIGIEGFLAGNSQRSVRPYPSQVVMTPLPTAPCQRHHRRACR
jgi:hypothetical protein